MAYEKYTKEYKNGPYPFWEFEASTNLYLLIDALNLDRTKS